MLQISNNLMRMRTTKRERVSLILKTKTSAYKRRRRVGMRIMRRCWSMSPIPLSYRLFVADEDTPLHGLATICT